MKIGFFSPYYDSLSGGERYVLTLASHWSKVHDVSIFWKDPEILHEAETRFRLDLSKVHVVPNIFYDVPFITKIVTSRKYDLIFSLSDGSIPTTLAKHNILHFQVPFSKIPFPFWKKITYQKIVVNSEFTKKNIDPSVGVNADVIYPPVDIGKLQSGKKEKIILSVGRFSSFFQSKKQEVLIDIFSHGVKKGYMKGWKLVMIGGLLPSDRKYFEMLVDKAKDLPIECIPNASFETLRDAYKTASIYWHAAGYEESDPQLMEHFGITTVEAMASGAIPVVYSAGGQPEIVVNNKNGYLWNTKDECIEYTHKIIQSETLQKKLRTQSMTDARKFSAEVFCSTFDVLLQKIIA